MSARPAQAAAAFGVSSDAIRRIGARANTHWRIRAGREVFVLRRFGAGPLLEELAAWEFALVRDLAALGWPVPRAAAPLRSIDGELWLLMAHIGGRKLAPANTIDAGYRRLGRELAGLHADLDRLAPRPQRPGWMAFAGAGMPLEGGSERRAALLNDLRRAAPDAAMALEAALADLQARDLPAVFENEPLRPIHGDFSPWNVLTHRGRLSGVLDFEMAHMDVPVADLAFARRGFHDAVVEGYLQVRPVPQPQLAALDCLWLGSLFFGLWRILEGWRRDGRPAPEQLDWHLQQIGKTRAYRPA